MIGAKSNLRHEAFPSELDDVDPACSSEVHKVAAVAADAGTCSAQYAFNDAGVDDAVWRDG